MLDLIALPSPHLTLLLIAAGASVAWGAGTWSGWLKQRRGIATNYTRKIFHFTIFSCATALHAVGLIGSRTAGATEGATSVGLALVNAFALGAVAVILLACWRGRGDRIYEAMARERDEPRRTLFIIVPLLTTALGGLVANLIAGDAALVGYLVTGWGDAVGEPAGRRWGRHPYRVASLGGVPAVRTLEGSAAVGIAAGLASALTLGFAFGVAGGALFVASATIGVATMIVEALSPHGTDNFTTMVASAALALLFL
jgi:phytol kinase